MDAGSPEYRTLGISFKAAKSGCWNLQAFSKYGHSWNSSSATGIGVSQMSISLSWTNYSNTWSQAGQPSGETRVRRS